LHERDDALRNGMHIDRVRPIVKVPGRPVLTKEMIAVERETAMRALYKHGGIQRLAH